MKGFRGVYCVNYFHPVADERVVLVTGSVQEAEQVVKQFLVCGLLLGEMFLVIELSGVLYPFWEIVFVFWV